MRPPAIQLSLIAACWAVVLGSSCGGAPAFTAGPSFANEKTLVAAWWPKEEAAFISGDASTLGPLFADSALEVATGQMRMQTLAGARPKYPRPFRDSTIFATSEDPRWFLAIIQFAPVDQDGRALPITMSAPGMLFTEADGVWKATTADVQAPIAHNIIGSGDSVFATPQADSRYLMQRSAIAGAYATYLNSLSQGQQQEVPFPTGIESHAWQVTRLQWPPFSIANAHFNFSVQGADVAEYAITAGVTTAPEVVVFVLRRTVTLTPKSGCLVRRQGDIWSGIVPSGAYRSVTLASISVIAATVPFNDGNTSQGRKIIDISGSVDDVASTTVNC